MRAVSRAPLARRSGTAASMAERRKPQRNAWCSFERFSASCRRNSSERDAEIIDRPNIRFDGEGADRPTACARHRARQDRPELRGLRGRARQACAIYDEESAATELVRAQGYRLLSVSDVVKPFPRPRRGSPCSAGRAACRDARSGRRRRPACGMTGPSGCARMRSRLPRRWHLPRFMKVREEPVTLWTIEMLPASRLESRARNRVGRRSVVSFVEQNVAVVARRRGRGCVASTASSCFAAARRHNHVHGGAERLVP